MIFNFSLENKRWLLSSWNICNRSSQISWTSAKGDTAGQRCWCGGQGIKTSWEWWSGSKHTRWQYPMFLISWIIYCTLYLSRHFILKEIICANQSESKFLSLPLKSFQNVLHEHYVFNFNKGKMGWNWAALIFPC